MNDLKPLNLTPKRNVDKATKKSNLLFLVSYFIVFFISLNCYSQKVDSLELLISGTNGFLVKEFPDKTSADIYDTLKKWMQYNIVDADYAQTSDIKNEYISFIISNAGNIRYKQKGHRTWTMNLNVEIRIKEGRMRIDIDVIKFNSMITKARPIVISSGGINDVILFKKNGEIRKQYKSIKDDIDLSLNKLATRIFNGVSGKVDTEKDDW